MATMMETELAEAPDSHHALRERGAQQGDPAGAAHGSLLAVAAADQRLHEAQRLLQRVRVPRAGVEQPGAQAHQAAARGRRSRGPGRRAWPRAGARPAPSSAARTPCPRRRGMREQSAQREAAPSRRTEPAPTAPACASASGSGSAGTAAIGSGGCRRRTGRGREQTGSAPIVGQRKDGSGEKKREPHNPWGQGGAQYINVGRASWVRKARHQFSQPARDTWLSHPLNLNPPGPSPPDHLSQALQSCPSPAPTQAPSEAALTSARHSQFSDRRRGPREREDLRILGKG